MTEEQIEKIHAYISHIQLSVLLQFALVCALVVLISFIYIDEDIRNAQRDIQSLSMPHETAFAYVDTEAEAVYVFDIKNDKVLYARNEEFVYPLASITKVATALTAIQLAQNDMRVDISPDAITITGDNGLLANESWNLSDLLDFSLLVSSNDGAYGVASVAGSLFGADDSVGNFVNEMNNLAREIGLEKTRFYNPTGLDVDSTRSGGYGSAKDVANLIAYIIQEYPELLEATKHTADTFVSLDNVVHQATNTNPIVGSIPGILASKTGYTRQSGGNLVIAFDPFPGRPIVIVVLGSSYDGRFEDIKKLSEATLAFIRE
jgi:D-alanyl-D-alanine carboxypeptidase